MYIVDPQKKTPNKLQLFLKISVVQSFCHQKSTVQRGHYAMIVYVNFGPQVHITLSNQVCDKKQAKHITGKFSQRLMIVQVTTRGMSLYLLCGHKLKSMLFLTHKRFYVSHSLCFTFCFPSHTNENRKTFAVFRGQHGKKKSYSSAKEFPHTNPFYPHVHFCFQPFSELCSSPFFITADYLVFERFDYDIMSLLRFRQ